jgi:AraC-like DNA-binding protein
MSPAPPLQRFALCRSSDVEEYTARINSVYYPGDVVPGALDRFAGPSTLHAVSEPDFTLGYMRLGGSAHMMPVQDATEHHVNVVLSGSVLAVSGNEEVCARPGLAAVHAPVERHELRTPAGTELIGVKLGRELVAEELGAMLGRPVDEPIRWTAALDLRSGPGRSWWSLLEFTMAELERPGLLDTAVVRHRHIRTLVAGLLAAQPHNHSAALADAGRPLRPRTVRRATDHVRDHFAEQLTVTDLAAAAGVSSRRLQEAFGTHLGTTPMAYLRDVRLDEVRRRLREGREGVTEAALACGFSHLGRFSAAYRDRFGELPSETLHR